MTSNTTPTFNPLFLHPSATPNPYILIVLNQPITSPKLFDHLWRHASLRISADGASNHLHSLSLSTSKPYTPDIILGDLDSISASTRTFFEEKNVSIEHLPSQYATDFTKCLTWGFSNLPEGLKEGKVDVVAYNSLGGRMDASFHSLHQLFLFRDAVFPAPEEEKERRGILWLVSPPNLAFLLPPGESMIELGGPEGDEQERKMRKEEVFGRAICGILPLAGERMVKTKGLRWDTEWVQGVGIVEGYGLSTSNECPESEVEMAVEGGGGVVFTVEMAGCWEE